MVVGSPTDLERLRAVLAALDGRPVPPRRVRVGDIEVEFLPSPAGDAHASQAGDESEAEHVETDRERQEREQREYEAGMYGASEGAN